MQIRVLIIPPTQIRVLIIPPTQIRVLIIPPTQIRVLIIPPTQIRVLIIPPTQIRVLIIPPTQIRVLIIPPTQIRLQFQGSPFSNPGFSFPSWQEPGLPTASLGYKKWRCLCPGIRLLLAREAFSAISEFFQLVLDDQLSLNPKAAELLRLLEEAKVSSTAVLSNLASAMEMLNFQSPSVEPDPWSWRSTGATSFQKKVRGYVLSREYKDWLVRIGKDMDLLKGARVLKDDAEQEKRDCCRP
ncbi:cardiotrophin-2-like [Xenopus tropicalis]|uniref:Cardiotrophin-2-like n=1 Tax=Xenopus tropicalis TaxID=8364 RepID=A0A8J1IUE2_XENTR|nr:cardiotrophin-2-like [Xenopus tropicalis]